MIRIGLTGGIASGKSVVAEMFGALGARLIDADVIAREVVEPGTVGLAEIVARFGPGILRPDGTLNRQALAALVFADVAARRDLEAIVHPAVRERAIEQELLEVHRAQARGQTNPVIVHVIPLLFETGQQMDFDYVVVVDCDPAIQTARLMARDGLSRSQAQARIGAQASRADRIAGADFVIPNEGSLDEVRARVASIWQQVTGHK